MPFGLGFDWHQQNWKLWLGPSRRAYAELPSPMEQIKMVIGIWPVQPVCAVWKHVVLRRPQRDNYCQLNYSACSPCVLWLRAPDPLTLSSSLTGPLTLLLLSVPTVTPPLSLNRPNMPFCKCLTCAHKTLLCFFLPLWQKPDAGSWIDVTFDVSV